VEDFVAALDYRYPTPAAGKLGIRTAAGPSQFGSPEAGLLQVGVQAGGLVRREITTVHLVLAIDVSSSMGRGNQLAAVRQGVRRLLEQLSPRDRVSLVLFGEEVLECIENASRSDAAAIDRLLASSVPAGGTNLAAGLQQAASLAMATGSANSSISESSNASATRFILITDSRAAMPDETYAQLAEVVSAAAATGAKLDVVDVSDRSLPDAVLSRLTAASGGEIRRAACGREIYSSLLALATSESGVIASEVKLSIRFNPQSVAAYRLLGHEANALAGLTAATTLAEFRAGDAATALLEIWFQPGDIDDVGTAELSWVDPTTGQPAQLRQRISRLQFAPTFVEAAPSLQQAAFVAEAAELLRGSHDALREINIPAANSRGFAGLLDAARNANPRLLERPDFQHFLRLVQALEKARPR